MTTLLYIILPWLVLSQTATVNSLTATTANITTATVGTNAPAGGQAFSDDFNRADADALGANWTEAVGDTDIEGNAASYQTAAYAKILNIYSGQALDTANGYALFDSQTGKFGYYPELVFRYTDASSPYYSVQFSVSEDLVDWFRYATAADTSPATVQQVTTITIEAADNWGITWTGTGDSTVVRCWRNPVATTPVSASEWDAGDSTPEVELTGNPASPVNTGGYTGIGGYQNVADGIECDNFYGGDL